jgi:pyridoxine/pyridoxamine 5'-phosphate oxidase
VTPLELIAFVRRQRLAVVASAAATGAPQAALVGIAVTDAFEVVFDTLASTRKALNLRRDGRAALVIGWDDEQTVQLEGVADEPGGAALEALKRCYFAAFPDGATRLGWPGITYFRVRPTWIRYSDFRAAPPRIVELSGPQLAVF